MHYLHIYTHCTEKSLLSYYWLGGRKSIKHVKGVWLSSMWCVQTCIHYHSHYLASLKQVTVIFSVLVQDQQISACVGYSVT